MLKYLIGGVLSLALLYGLMEAWPLLRGPSLTITSPTDHATVEGGILEVTGRAARVVELTLNGAHLSYDQQGAFSSTLTFPRGGSILTFVATDRFGRTVTMTRSIFVP